MPEPRPPDSTPGPAAARPPRSRAVAYAALVLGVLAALASSAQPWWTAGSGPQAPRVTFPGTDTTGRLSQALASVAAAGTLLTLALRRRGRAAVGVLLAVAGAGMAATGALRLPPSPGAVAARVETVLLGGRADLRPTLWPYAYAAAGLLVALGGVVLVLRARTWPTRAARFDRSRPGGAPGPGPADLPGDDPVRLWQALDAGVDPTERAGPPAADPDVTRAPEGTTMEPTEQPRRSPE